MAWLDEPPEVWIVSNKNYLTEDLYIIFGGEMHYQRTRTITQDYKSGMTRTAAEALALDISDDDNVTEATSERANDGGAYRVNRTLEEYSGWELV